MGMGFVILILAAAAWGITQVLKVVAYLITERRLDWSRLLASGGMPSSHSACVCACAASTGMLYGFESPLFAIAAVLAVVVMYDAANVRKATGEQAKILNYMMEHWEQAKPELFDRELKEMIGHSPLQVVVGGALGVAVGLVGSLPVIIM